MSAVIVAPELLARSSHPRTTAPVRTRQGGGTRVGHEVVRSCTVTGRAAVAAGPSDRTLLAVMAAVALAFLFGLVVMIHGFWAVSSAPEASGDAPAAVTTR